MRISRRQALVSLGATLSLPYLPRDAASPVALPRSDPGLFLAAVRAGDLPQVRRLLSADAGLARARDKQGRSAFVLAHLHGHVDVATHLLDTGLKLDLVEAVLAEDWKRMEELASKHPERLHDAHPLGGTPLYAAAFSGSNDAWRLRSLGCRSDAAPAGGNGFTPARGALESPHDTWALIGLTEITSNGGNVNAPQRGGSSVLHGAVQRRDERLVRIAIRKGANVQARDEQGRDPRTLANELGWTTGAELLAKHGELPRDNRASRFALDANREPVVFPDLSDVAQKRQSETTSSAHGNLKRVREIVSADPRMVFSISTDDELVIEACAHTGAREIIRFLLDHGSPLSLPTAVSLGDFVSVDFWLDEDPTLVHERGAHDFPVMWYAAVGGGGAEMAEHLANRGVDIDQESMGATTLHWCARRNATDLAAYLIEAGADIEPVGYRWDRKGETPLQVAQASGRTAIVDLLRAAGARR